MLDTGLGTVVTAGDYLTPSFGLFANQSGQGVISGGINTITGSTAYPSYSSFLFGGSVGSTINKYDIVGDSAAKTGIYSVSDPESLDINILVVPGWSADPDVAKEMISLCMGRGDCMAILDTPFGLSVQNVIEYKNTILNSASNYAAIYYPWVEILDTNSDKHIFVPPSGMVAGQYAYNDAVGDVFTAPAGRNRGNLLDALATERVLNLGDRDALTLAQINPIHSEAGFGVYIRGQMTLQSATTALNRVNVRRLLLNLRKVIATASKYFEFEPGDSVTALRLKQLAESTLDDRVRKGAIRSYTVDVGPNVNTAQVLENNQLHMVISVVPTKTAEIIVEIFNILPQGQGISITNA
jgi:phage tail sheath protein FI